MKLKKIKVNGLFNRYDYEINVEPQVTILHGPNGVGKSSVLKLVHATLAGKYNVLDKGVFREIEVSLEDGSSYVVTKVSGTAEDESKSSDSGQISRSLQVSFFDPDGTEHPVDFSGIKSVNPATIERRYPFLERVGPREWLDGITGEVLDMEDVLLTYVEESVPQVKRFSAVLVDANRLQRMDPRSETRYPRRHLSIRDTVSIYAEELASALGNKIVQSAAMSQDLDRTFPQRLISLMLDHSITSIDASVIEKQLADLERKRDELETVGLLDKSQQATFEYRELDEPTKRVLSLYVQDTQKKLAVFEEMAQKINLFLTIIKSRFRNKRMRVTRENGLVFTTDQKDELRPDQLSSGEQHELIMTYELLFKADPNSLILIDEPEISLHIEWQQEFLNDLFDVVALTGCQVIAATHSADIIRENWDITRGLGGN